MGSEQVRLAYPVALSSLEGILLRTIKRHVALEVQRASSLCLLEGNGTVRQEIKPTMTCGSTPYKPPIISSPCELIFIAGQHLRSAYCSIITIHVSSIVVKSSALARDLNGEVQHQERSEQNRASQRLDGKVVSYRHWYRTYSCLSTRLTGPSLSQELSCSYSVQPKPQSVRKCRARNKVNAVRPLTPSCRKNSHHPTLPYSSLLSWWQSRTCHSRSIKNDLITAIP